MGPSKDGFIESVGFDLYSQMLKQAIEERKGETPKEPPFQMEMDIKVDAYIPESYITDAKQKIEMYKRFKGIEQLKELQDLKDEMFDRFGEYPTEVSDLIRLTAIKLIGDAERIEKITENKDQVMILLTEETSEQMDGSKLFDVVNTLGREVSLGTEGKRIKVVIKTRKLTNEQPLDLLRKQFTPYRVQRRRKSQKHLLPNHFHWLIHPRH